MIMDPNQLEDADRRGVNPYAYAGVAGNQSEAVREHVEQLNQRESAVKFGATGATERAQTQAWADRPVDDGPDEFGLARSSLNPTEQADTSNSPLAEPEPGTVIGFTKHFREDGPGYVYVAIRVKGRGWFLTGSAAGATTWDDLLEFVDGAQLWVTRDWTRLS
jgi:hypothetical protein